MKRTCVSRTLSLVVMLLILASLTPKTALGWNYAISYGPEYSPRKFMRLSGMIYGTAGKDDAFVQGEAFTLIGTLEPNAQVTLPKGYTLRLHNIEIGVLKVGSSTPVFRKSIGGPVNSLDLSAQGIAPRISVLPAGKYYLYTKAYATYYKNGNLDKDVESYTFAVGFAISGAVPKATAAPKAEFSWKSQPNLGGSVTSVTYGKKIAITGTLQATYPISRVIIALHDSAGNAYSAATRKELTVASPSKTFSLSTIDPYIHMEVLPRGSWYITIRAYDSNGNHGQYIWWAKKFTVK